MADKKNVPCFFFRKGACRNGDNCPFSHDPNCPPAAQEPQQKAVPQQRAGAPSRFIYIEPKHPSVYYSIDVECVATDVQHNARATAQISLVSYDEQCILNLCGICTCAVLLGIQNDQKRVEELQKMLLATPLVPSFAKQVD
eukprot:766490-Hanusia_phi.AAC.2